VSVAVERKNIDFLKGFSSPSSIVLDKDAAGPLHRTCGSGGMEQSLAAGIFGTARYDTWGMGRLNDIRRFKSDLIALLPRLSRFSRTLTRSQTDAEDLVQETCIKALARHAQWDPTQSLDGWVFRIARNHWFDELRKRRVRTGEGFVDAEEAAELSIEGNGEATLAMGDLMSQINALPPDLASVLLLVCAEGYSYKEVASLMDIPLGTVMSRVYRARKLLSESMQLKSRGAV